MMLRRLAIVTAMAALALFAGTARAQQQQQTVTLRIATLQAPGTISAKVLAQLAADIATKTQQRVSLNVYFGGPNADEKDFVRKMGLGQLDGAELTSNALAMVEPKIGVLALPRLFASDAEADAVAKSAWPTYVTAFQKAGYILTDPDDEGWQAIYSRAPIDSLGALQNATAWEDPDDQSILALYAELGISGKPLPRADVEAALDQTQVDACYASPLEVLVLQWNKHVTYRTSLQLRRDVGAFVIAATSLASLSAPDQQVVLAELDAAAKKIAARTRRDDADAVKYMVQQGLTVVATPSQMEAALDAAAPKSWQRLVGSAYAQQDLDAVLQLRAAYRKRAGAAAAQPQPQAVAVVLQIATLAPPGSDWEKALTKLASDVDADTEHRVNLTFVSGADEKDSVLKINLGQLDGAELTSAGLSLFDPSVRVLELPAMFVDGLEYEHVANVAWPAIGQAYDRAGLVLAGREALGDLTFYSQQPLESLKAFTSASIRLGPADPVLEDLYVQLGIKGVVLPAGEVDAAFARHSIDTIYATATGLMSLWRSRVGYRSSLVLGNRTVAIVLTKSSVQGLSSADRDALLRDIRHGAVEQRASMEVGNNRAKRKQRLAPSMASADLAAAFDAAARRTWQDLVGAQYPQDLLDLVLKARDDYRAKHTSKP